MMKKRMTAGALAALMAAALPISACAAQNSAPQPQLNTAEHMQYMNGYTDGTFRPDASITRAEASKLLASLLVNKVKNEDHLFNDVSVSAWYADAVRQMTGFGLVNVHQRIRLTYGADYGLTLDSGIGQGTTITLRIPAIKEKKHVESIDL